MVKIDIATMTGADDSILPADLQPITLKFPFVEWGILMSYKRQGEPRYPGSRWIHEFLNLRLPCAAHICGAMVDDVVLGHATVPEQFRRVQLNFNLDLKGRDLAERLPRFIKQEKANGRSIIVQMKEANQSLWDDEAADHLLFDASGGRGVLPGQWPQPHPTKRCGYAGGLGPDNLMQSLQEIQSIVKTRSIWVDMETKIRSSNDRQFDLIKVAECLRIVSLYNLESQIVRTISQGEGK